jgi:hypothetical protein
MGESPFNRRIKMREIGFIEGYKLMRKAGADYISSVFVAFVWVCGGDKVSD